MDYQPGSRALFVEDETQREVHGVITKRVDKGDFLLLKIREYDGSIYWAKLPKRFIAPCKNFTE